MKFSKIIKRSVVLRNRKTSISLEDCFWVGLQEMAQARGVAIAEIISEVDHVKLNGSNLSSLLRQNVLKFYILKIEVGSSGK